MRNKQFTIMFILSVMLILIPLQTHAADWHDYTYLGLGYKDDMLNFNIARRYTDWGFEVGLGLNSFRSDLLDYPCPHSNYIIINDSHFSAMLGFDAIRYFDFDNNLTSYLGVGGYVLEYQKISCSNATGWFYTQSSEMEVDIGLSAGIQIHTGSKSGFGIGYHTLRGFNAYFMFGF